MSKRLFLIDGNSFCYRAFYAIRGLATSRGRPTNAIYGFITMLNKIIKEEKPDYLAVTFDLAGPTFRHEKFKDYKIQRQPMPDELVSQLPAIKEVIRGYNIPIFEKQGFEADDVLASLARQGANKSMDVYIVTGDKDALQLVDSQIKVYSPHKQAVIYDRKAVMERFGVSPDKMIELMALAGDKTDNIPGVPGIGEKTAIELIKEFGTLENVLASIDKIKNLKIRQALTEFAEQARLSRELATLDCNLSLDVDPGKLKLGGPDNEILRRLFKEFEFKSLLKELTPGKQAVKTNYKLISSKQEFNQLLGRLKKLPGLALDFETTAKDPMRAQAIGLSFSWQAGEAYYLPLEKLLSNKSDVFEKLKPILEDESIEKYGQNIKYEVVILANYGIDLKGIAFDTMVASYLLNPSKPNHSLDEIALEYLDYRKISLEDLIGKGKNKLEMRDIDQAKLCEYGCEDSDITMRLKKVLEPKLKDKGLYELFSDVEIPLIKVLARMEMNGVAIDAKMLALMSKTMQNSLQQLTSQIYGLAGGKFNINSPKQLAQVLFEKLKLPVVKRTKTGFSTDVRVLEKLASRHSLPAALLEYRELSKLKSTYVDALPQLINPRTKRVHTSFNQAVTATGRLSSSQPNLQNIPVRTQAGREIRKAIIAPDVNSLILSADYSQIELRVLAHLCEDETLIKAFKKDLDIHNYTASLVFSVDPKDVTSQMRTVAKTVNFGINYGMSPYGLSRSLGIEIEQAEDFINSYFARYPKVKDYITSQIKKARETGFVTTIFNRRRYIPGMDSSNKSVREFAERTAINTPVQGTAADLIKVAMIEIDQALHKKKLSAKMILQVHDELVFEVPKDELTEVKQMVKGKMEQVISLKVPIKVEMKSGKNWFEA